MRTCLFLKKMAAVGHSNSDLTSELGESKFFAFKFSA